MPSLFQADFTTLSAQDRYKLLCALVVPRPIALVTTLGQEVLSTPHRFRSSMFLRRTRHSWVSDWRLVLTAQ